MLTNSEKTVLYGVMAFIAYELYQQKKCACEGAANGGGYSGNFGTCAAITPPASTGTTMTTPGWIQQLSQVQGEDFFTPRCGFWGRCS